jgi:hypothetical protein
MHVLAGVGVGKVVLAEEVFAVVVAVGGAHYAMNVLLGGLIGVGGEPGEVRGLLVVELDQDYGALDAVVESAVELGAADPGEPGVFDVAVDFVHFHASMAVVHIADVEIGQIAQMIARGFGQIAGAQAGVVENHVVFESFG